MAPRRSDPSSVTSTRTSRRSPSEPSVPITREDMQQRADVHNQLVVSQLGQLGTRVEQTQTLKRHIQHLETDLPALKRLQQTLEADFPGYENVVRISGLSHTDFSFTGAEAQRATTPLSAVSNEFDHSSPAVPIDASSNVDVEDGQIEESEGTKLMDVITIATQNRDGLDKDADADADAVTDYSYLNGAPEGDISERLLDAELEIDRLRSINTALRHERHTLLGLSDDRNEAALILKFRQLSRDIEHYVSTLVPTGHTGAIFKNDRHSGRDHAWFRTWMPDFYQHTDKQYCMYALTSMLIIKCVEHHQTWGPFGLLKNSNRNFYAQVAASSKGVKNAGAYKRLLLTMESARQETEPTHREQVREQSIVTLKDRFVKSLDSLTTIHKNSYQVKSLRRIASSAVDLFELLNFTPATYRLIPFNHAKDQHDQCKIFDITMHDEIVPSGNQVLDGRPVYGIVFPGLMRQFDETGREDEQVIFKAKVLTQQPPKSS